MEGTMSNLKRMMACVAMALAMTVPVSAQKQEILVSAAASLTDVLTALKPEAEKYIGCPIVINFAGSGTLRAQIEEGAPVDVFFSAAASDMDKLENAGLLFKGSRKNLLSNAIVLVGDKSFKAPATVDELKSLLAAVDLLAIGNPDSVPAGRYAVEALKSLGLWETVANKLVLGNNVRQVLQFVESGSAPVGIVFLTDSATLKPSSPAARLYRFPEASLKTAILYPVAVVAASKNPAKAARLVKFFQGAEAKRAFTAAGFVVK
jgi:molybdate transport system substrate-binding protein